MAKVKDIKTLSKEERTKKVQELRVELIKMKGGSGNKGAHIKEIKKTIARLLTLNK